MDSKTPFIHSTAPQMNSRKTELLFGHTVCRWMRDNLLLVLTILAVASGLLLGCLLRLTTYDDDFVMLIGFPGDLLMRMLKMLIVPLVVSAIIAGFSQLDTHSSGRIGFFTIVYFFGTTMLAVVLGIFLVLVVHPGDPKIKQEVMLGVKNNDVSVSTLDAFFDLGRNMFPENLFQATFSQSKTEFVKGERLHINGSEEGLNWNRIKTITEQIKAPDGRVISTEVHYYKLVRRFSYKDGSNVLGLIVFCTAFGIICSKMGSKAELIIRFFVMLNEIIMRLVAMCMWYSPIGIASLIAAKILAISNMHTMAHLLGLYMFTVILGLIIHGLVTLPLIYFLITKKNPLKFFRDILQAFVTALGTASSAATLPVTIHCLEENKYIDKRVTRFVLPVGTSINMNGTALYVAVATIFISQINGVNLNFGQIIVVSLVSAAVSMGVAVQSGGLVIMILVLTSVGLPTEDISMIIAVDWLLDRIRTSINVLGDAFGAGVVNHLSKSELDELDAEHPNLNYSPADEQIKMNIYQNELELSSKI